MSNLGVFSFQIWTNVLEGSFDGVFLSPWYPNSFGREIYGWFLNCKRECTRIVTWNNKLIPAAPCATAATGLIQKDQRNLFQHAMRPAPRILKRNPNGILDFKDTKSYRYFHRANWLVAWFLIHLPAESLCKLRSCFIVGRHPRHFKQKTAFPIKRNHSSDPSNAQIPPHTPDTQTAAWTKNWICCKSIHLQFWK